MKAHQNQFMKYDEMHDYEMFNGAAKCSMDQPQRCRTRWGRTPPRATNSTRWRDVVCVLCRVIRPAAGGCRGI